MEQTKKLEINPKIEDIEKQLSILEKKMKDHNDGANVLSKEDLKKVGKEIVLLEKDMANIKQDDSLGFIKQEIEK